MTTALEQRWRRRGAGNEAWWLRLVAAYSESHRHYHTLAHLEHIFAEAATFEPLDAAIEWAIWFHDFVYDPRSSTNEADSAEVAREALREFGEPAGIVNRAAELILATRHGPGGCEGDDARLLISLDLAILAAAPARYDEYVAQVRAEYAFVPEGDFRRARAAFMQRFLQQPTIYPDPRLADYEKRARGNIERELLKALATPDVCA